MSMTTTTLPGFSDAVHEPQRMFKGLLDAISHPGEPYTPSVNITPPADLTPVCAAACLTLLDLETVVWLQPGLSAEVQDWLRFHTGCRFTKQPESATFAVVKDARTLPALHAFNMGTAEDPEASTTLLIQVQDFLSGELQQLSGPGILNKVTLSPPLPGNFWNQWRQNQAAYPQGIDCFLFTQQSVVGLPRTVSLNPSN
ncbi:MAG: phosphonate C-P lyase system protein PhnH [Cyanobacteria bacterium J06581_3]